MGLKLFDGDDAGEDDLSKIEINKEFARRYEHNKKREDLQRLEELKKKGLVNDSDFGDSSDESSEEEDSDEQDATKRKDLQFFDALIKIKNQDPILKDKEAKLFESGSDSESDEDGEAKREEKKSKKANKPMYLKDVVSKHLMEEGPEFGDDEEEEEEDGRGKVKTYSEEQEELRKAFLNAVKEEERDEDAGELLKVKESGKMGDDDEDEGIATKLDEYFGGDEKLDEDMKFLKDYFRNRMWVDERDKRTGLDLRMDDDIGFSEDEEEIEKQEDYEREYNFRFEENAGDRVMGHSRIVEGSVRKTTNTRKLQRERKEERMTKAEAEQKEELKRLKNLKKKEIREKLSKIKETAGIGDNEDCLLDEDDLENEFDPQEHDRKMREAFGDEYYHAEDVDPEFGSDKDEDDDELKKPDFDQEDELLGLPKGWDDVIGSGDGFLSTRERILKNKEANGIDIEHAEDEDVEAEGGKRKKKRKRANALMQAARDELMEEYYKLDYEDTIGDLKTRFKYRPVKSKRYGLNTEEILALDDKELNQYVPLKKLAPYREKEWKVPHSKTIKQKERTKELLRNHDIPDIPKFSKKKKADPEEVNSSTDARKFDVSQQEKSNDGSNLSRRSRRRRRQAELKIAPNRLEAYRNASKSKSKK